MLRLARSCVNDCFKCTVQPKSQTTGETPLNPMPVIYTDLKDKVALITGVGQVPQDQDEEIWGNGAATAKVLAATGMKIFGCDIDLASAELIKKRVEADVPDANVHVMQADVTKKGNVEELVRLCMETHGRIDVLVCNVGKSAPGGPAEMSNEVRGNFVRAHHP